MANKSDLKSNLKIKPSVSEEIYTTSYSLRSGALNNEKCNDPGTTFEVFRNNTTAVEVIVKETPAKSKKTVNPRTAETTQQRLYDNNTEKNDFKYERMLDEIEQLKSEVYVANKRYFTAKRDLKCLVFELKKQLDMLCQREIEEQTTSLALQLQNEKLQTMMDSQSVIINRLKKELVHMKRALKFVVKGICMAPQGSNNLTYTSDIEYDDFEKGLKKKDHVKFPTNFDGLAATGIGGNTFDSTFPSFDKL